MSRQIENAMGKYPIETGSMAASNRFLPSVRSSRWTTSLALWLTALLLAGTGMAHAQDGNGVCRATTVGSSSNNGSVWAQAMPLQTALGNLACGEIWVAEGVYKPTSDVTEPDTSFVIRSGTAVYGGFLGTEINREQRDPATHRSVLSGDIGGDDTVDAEGVTQSSFDIVGVNASHVVKLGGDTLADTVVDGFTVTGGQAIRNDVSLEDGAGGGLLCNADGATQVCNPTLRNLIVRGNLGFSGGGMSCIGQNQGICAARLENVTFLGNFSVLGGGMLSAGTTGGTSSPTLDNVTFSGNGGPQGGAGFGSAAAEGGSSTPVLRNATFNGNDTTYQGSSGPGGAIASVSAPDATGHVTLINTILWGNIPDQVAVFGNGTATIDHSIVQGGCPANVSCTHLVAGNPQLGLLQYTGVTPVILPGTNSAALDAGICTDAPVTDQRGIARPQGPACDIGAVEIRQAQLTIDVNGSGKVDALPTQTPIGAPIANCRQDNGNCSARYYIEPDAPVVSLMLQADAGNVLQSAGGCGSNLAGSMFTTAVLQGNCTVEVVYGVATHSIGGTVTGLAGSDLVLVLNDDENLHVDADGTFAFDTPLTSGSPYAVTIGTQPSQPSQACAVINGNGTVASSNITNVVIHCGAAATYTVGGLLSGLAPGTSITLSVNGGNALTVAANGDYVFAPRFAPGDGYLAGVTAQPGGQHCTLSHAEGTVGNVNVTDINVSCSAGGPLLQLNVTDGSGYARYGQVRDYFVSLSNSGNGTATNIAVSADLDPAFDEANVQWACVGGASGTACTAQGAGSFVDTATLPPGTSLVWIVRVPIRADSNAANATLLVHAAGAADAGDTNTLVIFRDGVDVPYADGAGVVDPAQRDAATPVP